MYNDFAAAQRRSLPLTNVHDEGDIMKDQANVRATFTGDDAATPPKIVVHGYLWRKATTSPCPLSFSFRLGQSLTGYPSFISYDASSPRIYFSFVCPRLSGELPRMIWNLHECSGITVNILHLSALVTCLVCVYQFESWFDQIQFVVPLGLRESRKVGELSMLFAFCLFYL